MTTRQATIELSKLDVGDRFRKDLGDMDELVESIKENGIIQPIAVKTNGDRFDLMAGGRRVEASIRAGKTNIPALIFDSDASELDARIIELIENIHRKNLDYREETALAKKIVDLQTAKYGRKISTSPDAEGVSLRSIASKMGISPGKLIMDVRIGEAIEKLPQLGLDKCKNKKEALKVLNKATQDIVRSEIYDQIKSRDIETPVDKKMETLEERYYLSDVFKFLKPLPSGSFDMVEVDPPFAINLNKVKKRSTHQEFVTAEYNEIPPDEYIKFLQKLLSECNRVLARDGWLVVWLAINWWYREVQDIVNNLGLDPFKSPPCIWTKGGITGQTNNPDMYLGSSYESFIYVRKGSINIVRAGRSNQFDFRPIAPQKKVHPTEKPIELMEEIYSTFLNPGTRILIPFLGSGNGILAADNLGMEAFGCDNGREYRESYVIKVHSGEPGHYKSYI